MRNAEAKTIYLKDYQQPAFWIDTVDLVFDLEDDHALVTASVDYKRNADSTLTDLELFGEELELEGIAINGYELSKSDYQLTDSGMTLSNLADEFTLVITTKIYPHTNTSLDGLYQSSGNFCTQCEAQGFRKITYFLDRPDVMGVFTTTIRADKKKNPVMLSNGNLIASGDLDGDIAGEGNNGKHFAKWNDPFKKPAYLFALVAGDLEHVSDTFTTMSGREVNLEIYTEEHNIDKCDHAMQSLKRAMKWDEERFGLEYDLDIFMIVAVDDFNMGAMENKGLNVFNSKLVFASPETATDNDYINIEAVIGHEYFHNWTGNRVTCRDWFQLSLKEGLTVFRDQEFTSDMNSRAVKRIEDVRMLRTHQFTEDSSPMAHPIRPQSFMEINNFYTMTVYEKGAEVVRLYNTLLGQDGFRKGMDLYFERHDGQAVTTEDFLAAMADGAGTEQGIDLSQMQNWYDQAGTPILDVNMEYDADAKTCTLNFSQRYFDSDSDSDAPAQKPVLIPMNFALLNQSASDDNMGNELDREMHSDTIQITKKEQSITLENIESKPLPSLLRDFSAPVKLNYDYSVDDTIFLMQHDSDDFNRWEASQRLAKTLLLEMLDQKSKGEALGVEPKVIDAYQDVLENESLDHALRAEALTLPSETDLAEMVEKADPEAIHEVRQFLVKSISQGLRLPLESTYEALQEQGEYKIDAASIGKRRLKNVCLNYLGKINDPSIQEQCYQQFSHAQNMTDTLSALAVLMNVECPQRQQAIDDFEQKWQHNTLVMDKWFAMQASSSLPDTLDNVKILMNHKLWSIKNPNKVRSLIGAFAMGNPVNFHKADGSGYQFHADRVLELDKLNPQVASRMVRALMNWRHYEEGRSELMRTQLERIKEVEGLSGDVFEIVTKAL